MTHRLLDRVTGLARCLEVTRGCKVRIDATVVPTAIHHPRIARRWRIRWTVVHKAIGTSRSVLSQFQSRTESLGRGRVRRRATPQHLRITAMRASGVPMSWSDKSRLQSGGAVV